MAQAWGKVQEERRTEGRRKSTVRHRIHLYAPGPGGTAKLYRIGSMPIEGGGTLEFHDRETAESVLQAIRGQVLNGKTKFQAIAPFLSRNSPETRFLHHWNRMLNKKALRTNRRPVSERRLRDLRAVEKRGYLAFFEEVSIFEITTPLLESWLDWLDTKFPHLAPKTVKNAVTDVGTFLNWLRREGELDGVPDLPDCPIGQQVDPVIPDEDTLAAYIAAIPEPERGLFLARSYNGLRPSEARALNVSDFDFKRKRLRLSHTKNKKAATLPLDPELEEWLLKWVTPRDAMKRPAIALFQNPRSLDPAKRWTQTCERRVHARACDAVGHYFKPNDIGRKAAATHALRRTKDIHAVQKLLRHADPRTTERYAKLADDALVSVLRPRQG